MIATYKFFSFITYKICSFKSTAASPRYTEHEKIPWYLIVSFSNPGKVTVFSASSFGFPRIHFTVQYSSMNSLKTERLNSRTFNRFTYVQSLVHALSCREWSVTSVKKLIPALQPFFQVNGLFLLHLVVLHWLFHCSRDGYLDHLSTTAYSV